MDADFARVTGRGLEPMPVPPPATDHADTDIAFAASSVMEGGLIAPCFPIEDRIIRRAIVRRYA